MDGGFEQALYLLLPSGCPSRPDEDGVLDGWKIAHGGLMTGEGCGLQKDTPLLSGSPGGGMLDMTQIEVECVLW